MPLELGEVWLWFSTWMFLFTRHFYRYQYFLPLSLRYFLKTLTLLITFEQQVLELLYLIWAFLVTKHLLLFTMWPWPLSLTYFFENLKLFNNFWTASARALIFHMSIHFLVTRPLHNTNIFILVTLTLELSLLLTFEVDPLIGNFKFSNNLWTVSVTTLIKF